MRVGVKDFSSWPTIPQVFFKGEFVGGCDILLQMHQSGELIQELEKIGIKSALVGAIAEDEKQ
jgi:monothiol glutaredoxin